MLPVSFRELNNHRGKNDPAPYSIWRPSGALQKRVISANVVRDVRAQKRENVDRMPQTQRITDRFENILKYYSNIVFMCDEP